MKKEGAKHICKVDRVLGRYIKKIGPMTLKLKKAHSPFEALFESIVYQQLSGKAAGTILSRVLDLYPKKRFPKPEDILKTSDKKLRGAGMSFNKIAAVKDLAAKTIDGTVPTLKTIMKMSDEEIIERLTQIRGIGRWTVEMLLIFKLGRHDILPAHDYGVRKGFMLVYKKQDLPLPKELEEFGVKWKPYRTVAAWYLWRVLDMPN